MADLSTDVHAALQPTAKWLESHHRAVKSDTPDGETYHVFAIVTKPVFAEEAESFRYDVSIDFPISVVTIQLRGWIDFSTLACDITVYAKVSLLPAVKIGRFEGNLKDGITISFGVSFISGWIKLFVQDDWVWAEFGVTIFGTSYSGKIKLIPIPKV